MDEFIVAVWKIAGGDVHRVKLRLANHIHGELACFLDVAKTVLALAAVKHRGAEKQHCRVFGHGIEKAVWRQIDTAVRAARRHPCYGARRDDGFQRIVRQPGRLVLHR